MGVRAAVAGASGYAGGELLRLLLDHPSFDVGPITAGSHAGSPVTSVHSHLLRLGGRTFESTEPDVLSEADVVFLALPHGESAGLASMLPASTPVVDLGADHRLADREAWERFYGSPHSGRWTYGLPELPGARESIVGANRVANPGCHATAVTLALAPLLAERLVEPTDLVAVAASGTSGAGRSAKPHLLGSEVMGSLSPYKVGGVHQHIPEIEQALTEVGGVSVTLSFTPVLAPMPRGILATCTARVQSGVGEAQLREACLAAYRDEPFVHMLPENTWPRTDATLGSNAVHLQLAYDSHVGRAVVVAALDNLGKGAAGQALQNGNLLLGLGEATGLSAQGVAP
ncbi:MAG: N-acetyl-gamma-glutamyl-phosphate reductase [Streptosporangiales bacterium]|nr:N-acetyl-gamma-glutamyl-phosphate reductase [Streptosporangiales bacterium]